MNPMFKVDFANLCPEDSEVADYSSSPFHTAAKNADDQKFLYIQVDFHYLYTDVYLSFV